MQSTQPLSDRRASVCPVAQQRVNASGTGRIASCHHPIYCTRARQSEGAACGWRNSIFRFNYPFGFARKISINYKILGKLQNSPAREQRWTFSAPPSPGFAAAARPSRALRPLRHYLEAHRKGARWRRQVVGIHRRILYQVPGSSGSVHRHSYLTACSRFQPVRTNQRC